MEKETYVCEKCEHEIPISNKVLHEFRCPGPMPQENSRNQNNENFENQINDEDHRKNLIKKEESIKLIPEPFTCPQCNQTLSQNQKEDHMLSHNLEMSEYKENNEERRERNGERRNVKIIRESNGFIKESFEEDLENGNIRITSLLKDPNGNIISRQSNILDLRGNNNINNMKREPYIRNNYGNNVETVTRELPNGATSIKTITKDMNGNILSEQEQIRNNNNNIMNNMNVMSNMSNMNMISNMNNMNNMNMMNRNMNIMNNMMNSNMNFMNNMMNSNMNMNMNMNMMNNNMNMNMNMMNNNMNMMNNVNMMNNANMMNNMNMMNNVNKINMINQMNMMNKMNTINMANQIAQNNITFTRLKKEFDLCSKDDELKGLGCQFQLENNNFFAWRVTLKGPKDTPYEGGVFTIRITFPLNYPKFGPEFRFLNQIYHLNVDFTDQTKLGHICLNFLNEWTTTGRVVDKPCYGVKQALIDIFCLFYNQNIKSAYNETMAQEYQSNMAAFNSKAKEYTQKYAKSALLL